VVIMELSGWAERSSREPARFHPTHARGARSHV
jgi:hypothetical protein